MIYLPCSYWFTQKKLVILFPLKSANLGLSDSQQNLNLINLYHQLKFTIQCNSNKC
jgi:hypothetical protein